MQPPTVQIMSAFDMYFTWLPLSLNYFFPLRFQISSRFTSHFLKNSRFQIPFIPCQHQELPGKSCAWTSLSRCRGGRAPCRSRRTSRTLTRTRWGPSQKGRLNTTREREREINKQMDYIFFFSAMHMYIKGSGNFFLSYM